MPPRIIRPPSRPNGTRTDEPRPEGVQVVSAETARTVRQMLRATVQRDPQGAAGHRVAGLPVEGYQITGKTGTAQQIDPGCGATTTTSIG